MKECPKNRQGYGNGRSKAQSFSVAPPDIAISRGATSRSGKGANYVYAITSLQK